MAILNNNALLSPTILFEDAWFMALNKPAGWVVNRAESVHEATIQDWLEAEFPSHYAVPPTQFNKTFIDRSGVAHRLDKETSGVLLVAKNVRFLAQLMELFKKRNITKQYQALVHGKVSPSEGFVRLPLARNIYNRSQFSVDPLGKTAYTEYIVVSHYTKPQVEAHMKNYSLLELAPKTGRTHQIRVHCKYIGHPLVSDALYTSKNQLIHDLAWCPRHFLHASRLAFVHPETQQMIRIAAPFPNDLQNALALLIKN